MILRMFLSDRPPCWSSTARGPPPRSRHRHPTVARPTR